MSDTELRRVLRVVYHAIDQVRDAYREMEGTSASPLASPLERLGQHLWNVQGLLLSESPERHTDEIHSTALALRRDARALSRLGQRDLADTLLDTADALEAWTKITTIAFESGLAG